MPEEKHPLRVFISYASQDKVAVHELSQRLANEGWIDPWIDEKKLLPGQDWRTKIEEAVETSDNVIICLSSSSVGKEGFVQKELRYAREIAFEKPDEIIFLIPLRLDNCLVPRGLRFFQWGDYFGEKQDDTYAALLEALKIRHEQKIKLETEKHARLEKERKEREAAEKAEREKTEREAVKKITQERLEHEIWEKATRERLEREATEKLAREKARFDKIEKIRREKAERIVAHRAVLVKTIANLFSTLYSNFQKPIYRMMSIIVIIIFIILAGSWGISKFPSNSPTEKDSITSTGGPSTVFTLTVQLPTKTLSPKPTSATTETPAPATLPTEITDAKGVLMIVVPAGEFVMGKNDSYDNEGPAHKVYLTTYYIDKFEVTNAQYRACVDAAVCDVPEITFSELHSIYYGNPGFNNYPVIYVTWNNADRYCRWRDASLPTEAQWEKAARGTYERQFPWGYYDSEVKVNYDFRVGDTSVVGEYSGDISPYGVYDMAGNVREWTSDWYLDSYYSNSLLSNPLGPNIGDFRVIRGGSWTVPWNIAETTYRSRALPTEIENDIGFRCSKSVEVSETDGMKMMYVPAGEFEMGSSEALYEDEMPAHSIFLNAYWIDKTEITNKQYQACVEAGICDPPSDIKSYTRKEYYSNPEFDNHPVIYVDWNNANRYCKLWAKRNLPSEAQWEKAARGIDGRVYPWGNEKPNALLLNYGKIYDDTTEVGKFPKGVSPYGALDMAGNVMEWVNDWYLSNYYKISPYENPLGPQFGNTLVFRGNTFIHSGTNIQIYSRSNNNASYNDYALGFRCAKDAVP